MTRVTDNLLPGARSNEMGTRRSTSDGPDRGSNETFPARRDRPAGYRAINPVGPASAATCSDTLPPKKLVNAPRPREPTTTMS